MAAKTSSHNILLHLRPYILALCCTLGILGLHMLPSMDSMLNENNTEISHVFLRSQIDYHKEIAPFARRPLTTLLFEGSIKIFGIKAGHAFIMVNFFLLFLSGILLFRLSRILGASSRNAIINLFVYFSSFSIFFAFFPPVFTYDEPLQYCFILGAFIAYVQRKWLWYLILFTLALITRETSVLLLPGFILFLSGMGKLLSKERLKYVLVLLSPLMTYTIFIGVFIWKNELVQATQIEMTSRYTCFLENFESTKNTIESLTSIFLTLGPFLYLGFMYTAKIRPSLIKKSFLRAFFLTVAINTPIVMLTAFARESRLFVLPLLFIWPMFMQLFEPEVKSFFSLGFYTRLFEKWWKSPLFLGLALLNYWFCFSIYDGLGLGQNTYFSEYLFFLNLLLILHFMASPISFSKRFSKFFSL